MARSTPQYTTDIFPCAEPKGIGTMKMYGKAHQTANLILEAFQDPDSLPKALAPIFIHRKDDVPCRKWSWRNQLLTAIAGTHDARGYRQWQQVDRHVKKGCKAFNILSPCTTPIVDDETGEKRPVLIGFRATSVFRAEDTEGQDLPTGDPQLDQWIAELPLREVAEAWGITVHTFDGEDSLYLGKYSQRGDSRAIALGVQNVEVFLHELMHAADHRQGTATEQRWKKEVVAEFGAAVLAECLGLECSNLGGSFHYISSHAEAAEQAAQQACFECLDRICRAVALILDTAETLKSQTMAMA